MNPTAGTAPGPGSSREGGSPAAVMFDMDGTLVNTEPLWLDAEVILMQEYGVRWTLEDQMRTHGGPAIRTVNNMADLVAASGQDRPDPESFLPRFEPLMLELLATKPVTVQPGAMELLSGVRSSGCATALVTSSPRVLMEAVLAQLGREWFDTTVCFEDVPHNKPHPMPYVTAAATIGIDPGWSVAIEDSPTGIASASGAGAFVVALTHSADISQAPRRRTVGSLTEVSAGELGEWFTPPHYPL